MFAAAAHLGSYAESGGAAKVTIAFLNASGSRLATAALGPVSPTGLNGAEEDTMMFYRREIGSVPALTRKIQVTIDMTPGTSPYNGSCADEIAVVLNQPAAPQSVIGPNLMVNGDAEAGPASFQGALAVDLAGWSRTGQLEVEAWADPGEDFARDMPGPINRGRNLFTGGGAARSTAWQFIDVSAGAGSIDQRSIRYNLGGWLGGYLDQGDNAAVAIEFQRWDGTILGRAGVGPVTARDRGNETKLLLRETSGVVPEGTRKIRVQLAMLRVDGVYNDGYADNLWLTLTGGTRPVVSRAILASGFGGFSTVAPNSWIEIFGSNLASAERQWSGSDFRGVTAPVTLDGVSVKIDGRDSYLYYMNPGQVNALVPDGVASGPVSLTVTTPQGTSDPYTITVTPMSPGLLAPPVFTLAGKQHVVALFADGTYVLPVGAIGGVPSRPAKPGETITLYGIGFGPVTPAIAAGTICTQSTSLVNSLQVSVGGVASESPFKGLAPNFVGLYQFNLVVPAVAAGEAIPLTFNVGGRAGTQTLHLAVGQ